ncbi:ATP-binding protein [Actinoplanes sp. NBRC 103695]|uniref:ATP-binding protein n=1 Tax=Actinoplanes sp. NBRC 103695 TaxID=3032202 RepID=UPI0024A1CFB5|nr:ATP-binding protein [Actinoplanes sp. NBRC 103695]GLY93945.1 hypothetical protein Acsp02_12010 [Actinoplanes sp. NBRC 103695]
MAMLGEGKPRAMVGLRSAPPPPATALQQWVLADYADLRLLRAALRRTLDAENLLPGKEVEDLAHRMTVVATELATNALSHARSPATVRLSRTRKALVLDVADGALSAPPEVLRARPLGAGGRGLQIVQEMATDSGWYTTNHAKHVWAEFGIPRRGRRFATPRISVFDLETFIRLLRRTGS